MIDEFLERLREYGARSCVEDGACTYTYARLVAEIEMWERRVAQLGAPRNYVVGLRADYSLSSVAALLGMLAAGASIALVPRDQDEARYLTDARAAAALDVEMDGRYSWRQVEPPPLAHPLIEQLNAAGDSGVIIFTSGSTGRPKAALHSIRGFLQKFSRPGRCMRTLAFLLLDHVAGLDTMFYTLANGGALILTRRRDPQTILQLIEVHRVEVLPASPSFLRMLCAAPSDIRDLSSLKIITYGSEPMDPTTLARLNARFANLQISQKYGTTETGSPRTQSRGNDSLWLKIKDDAVQSKVVDGILWIRSAGTLLGYLNAPSPVDPEGWYCTGDLVDVDGEWIRFRGRSADTIKVAGEKVAPAEIEQVILELEFVREAVVCGEPHPLLGQVAAARVALRTPMDPKDAAKRIRAHCRGHLPSYKVPLRVDIAADNFTTARQKMQRTREPR